MNRDPLALIRSGPRLPERSVPICMAADLVAEFEELDRERHRVVGQPAAEDSLAGPPGLALARQMEDLRQEMEDNTVVFRLRALTRPQFQSLKRAHPPRKGDDGIPNQRDAILGVNEESFFGPLLRACLVDPHLDDDTFRVLVDERLTDGQYERLTDMCWALNTRQVDVPFSPAASDLIRNSAAG